MTFYSDIQIILMLVTVLSIDFDYHYSLSNKLKTLNIDALVKQLRCQIL
jgi:hypothetical protein